MSSIADIRIEYKKQRLLETDVANDPITQFSKWWDAAVKSEIFEVNAMTLATVTEQGLPAARIVLLKGFDEKGFVFFTNYQSNKGHDLATNPHACLVFFWAALERQVRISGTVEKVSAADSDTYFASRPASSKIGAWSSPQSNIIEKREVIEENAAAFKLQFNDDIPRPPHWGGYIVKPSLIEFWQGRPSRLHDRILYTLEGNDWKIERLAP